MFSGISIQFIEHPEKALLLIYFKPYGKITLKTSFAPSNASFPIVSIVFGKTIVSCFDKHVIRVFLSAVISKPCSKRKCSDLQSIYSMPDSRKGLPSISIMLSGSVKLFSEVHPQRKLEGICLIVFGIFIFSNELQQPKLLSANCSTISGISTDLSDLHIVSSQMTKIRIIYISLFVVKYMLKLKF